MACIQDLFHRPIKLPVRGTVLTTPRTAFNPGTGLVWGFASNISVSAGRGWGFKVRMWGFVVYDSLQVRGLDLGSAKSVSSRLEKIPIYFGLRAVDFPAT